MKKTLDFIDKQVKESNEGIDTLIKDFIDKQVKESNEGIDTLIKFIASPATTYDELLKHGRSLSKQHGRIEAFLEVKKQILKG